VCCSMLQPNEWVLQSVVECCRVLQSAAVRCENSAKALLCVAECFSSTSGCCRVLQSVAVCCSVLQIVAASPRKNSAKALLCVAECCNQTSWCCSVLQGVAVRCTHIELPAMIPDYFLRSNKSNINPSEC